MKMLKCHGYSIPDSISVTGFDDPLTVRACEPSLTSIHQGASEAARLAVDRLIWFCVLAAVTVLACSPVSAKTVVKYWATWGGIEGEYIKAVVDRYSKSQSRIEVKYSDVSADQICGRFLTTTVAGAGPDLVGL